MSLENTISFFEGFCKGDTMTTRSKKGAQGLLPVGAFVQKFTKATLLKRGIHRHRILVDWKAIVGDKLAELSCPVRITRPKDLKSGGVLHLQVLSGASLLIEASQALICERINCHYGYRVVERLKILQTPTFASLKEPPKKIPPHHKRAPPPAPDFLKLLDQIQDSDLREALKDFSETFYMR